MESFKEFLDVCESSLEGEDAKGFMETKKDKMALLVLYMAKVLEEIRLELEHEMRDIMEDYDIDVVMYHGTAMMRINPKK